MLRAKIDLRQPIFLLKFTEDRDRFKVQETPGSEGFSMEIRWIFRQACLDQGRHGSARTCSLHCTLTPVACAARSARSVPGQTKIREVGRGLSLADTKTGRYGRLYSRRRLCARRGADARLLLRILLELLIGQTQFSL
jgi:hypothetical protein